MAFLLLVAGHETTVNLIGNGTLALLRNPDQLAELRADPSLVPAAVEEFLRLEAPVKLATMRFTAEPVTIAGADIPAGEIVLLSLGSANRDPAHYERPDELDLHRNTSNLAFGHGIHHCLGARWARIGGRQRVPGAAASGCPGSRWPARAGWSWSGATAPCSGVSPGCRSGSPAEPAGRSGGTRAQPGAPLRRPSRRAGVAARGGRAERAVRQVQQADGWSIGAGSTGCTAPAARAPRRPSAPAARPQPMADQLADLRHDVRLVAHPGREPGRRARLVEQPAQPLPPAGRRTSRRGRRPGTAPPRPASGWSGAVIRTSSSGEQG